MTHLFRLTSFSGTISSGCVQTGSLCLDPSGKPVWQCGAANRYGNGPFMPAQGMFYVLNDGGTLALIEASTESFKILAQAKVLEGPDAWGPMALASGRLILSDLNKMICLDVSGP